MVYYEDGSLRSLNEIQTLYNNMNTLLHCLLLSVAYCSIALCGVVLYLQNFFWGGMYRFVFVFLPKLMVMKGRPFSKTVFKLPKSQLLTVIIC